MKKIACLVILAGWFVGGSATDARVFTMGGHDDFFMDDYSIFRNPANINYYPNMLIGSPSISLAKDTGPVQAPCSRRTLIRRIRISAQFSPTP